MGHDGSPVSRFAVESQDPEHAHDVLREAYADFTVRARGPREDFVFSHAGVAAPGTVLARVRYGTSVEVDVHPQPDRLIVSTLLGGRALSRGAGRASVRAPVGEPLLVTTGTGWSVAVDDVEVDTLTLDAALVGRTAAAVFGIDPAHLSFSATTPCSPAAARYWRRQVAFVEGGVLADDEVAAGPLALAEAVRSLATATLVTFANSGLRALEDTPDPRPAPTAVLRRALAYIDEHAGEDIGVDDIAAAARSGVRALQQLFRQHRDRTPTEELRRVRMARAHADLRQADPTRGDTVAAIAARWGFANPGRFAVDYRRVHGCPPSETLRR